MQNASELIEDRTRRTKWYVHDRFGMFIHWGLYSIPAVDEWIRNQRRLTVDEYQPYFDHFNPQNYDPCEWARLAKQAGMKYAVLTAKHHDGFCLFDSKYTDYKITNTPYGKDAVREFLEAFRAEGLRVGLYFSLLDWYHPDYPHYGDMHHPMRENEAYKEMHHDFARYLKYMHNQIEELVTGYGKLDIMWFDFSYGEMTGEKWQPHRIMELVRTHQPDMIIDNRMDGGGRRRGSILTAEPKDYSGDFASPEQMVPPEGVLNDLGQPVPWESCITLNKHWCYSKTDQHFKSAKLIIRSLVECVSKNGNLLLNVGPDANGEIPAQTVEILEEVGKWMSRNGESIYGCGASEFEKPEWGRFTQNGDTLYAHVYEEAVSAVCLPNLSGKVKSLRSLATGDELEETMFWTLTEYIKDHAFFFMNPAFECSYPLPDSNDSVVKIELEKS